jgi:ABC-2 type transport system permease protein
MKKYIATIKIEWQRALTYRADTLGFRLGNFFEIMIQIVIWTAIFEKNSSIGGYSYPEMITYILIGWLISLLTANFGFEYTISRQIQQGELSNYTTKPFDYIKYIIALSIGRASTALAAAFLMNILLIALFSRYIIFSHSIFSWLIIISMILVGYFIKLFISVLTGFIAFWTIDISGVFYSVNLFSKFLAGNYFPLSLLPLIFVKFSFALPFIYTFYFPVQLYLGKLSITEGLRGLGIEIIWLGALYFLTRSLWKLGLKKYESVGI